VPEYLQAFNPEEVLEASAMVNRLVRSLQGRKVEEGDWTSLYCEVKGAPDRGWSNLSFRDYLHDGIGVEFKILSNRSPSSSMSRWVMHPAATRRINFQEDGPADEAMRQIFEDWCNSIDEFEQRVKRTSKRGTADLRWGILLWAPDHSEFLYFEERLEKPDPKDFHARWHDGKHRGKPTRNLHIFDRATDEKRFSCTLPRNGAKLQPYFRVPTVQEGAHLFRPEPLDTVPIFIKKHDMDLLVTLYPSIDPDEALSLLLQSEEQRRGS
jgi:hypothetical protein